MARKKKNGAFCRSPRMGKSRRTKTRKYTDRLLHREVITHSWDTVEIGMPREEPGDIALCPTEVPAYFSSSAPSSSSLQMNFITRYWEEV